MPTLCVHSWGCCDKGPQTGASAGRDGLPHSEIKVPEGWAPSADPGRVLSASSGCCHWSAPSVSSACGGHRALGVPISTWPLCVWLCLTVLRIRTLVTLEQGPPYKLHCNLTTFVKTHLQVRTCKSC